MAASRTAEYVALYRALETCERRREPLFSDPLARRFLTGSRRFGWWLARIPGLRVLLERYADRTAPGARTSAIGRTRYIDDVLRTKLAKGISQLVILGAGYDARAHRISELADVRVYEVDRADTQAAKRKRIDGARGVRTNVRYVPVDFQLHHLGTKLADAGWSADRRSIFIWEGVTNYLDEAAVTAVLDMVARTKPGGVIAFTYIHRGVLDGSVQFEGADVLVANVKKLGEPWKFGLVPGELPAYLAGLGLSLEEDLGADDYRARYLEGMAPFGGYAYYRIAVARVRGTPVAP